jgi:hypothetical protein
VLFVPTLADIRATGLLAHSVQAIGADDALRLEIAGRDRRFDANPIWFGQHRLIGPMRPFRMTRSARFSNAIDQYGHRGSRFRAGSTTSMILTVADWVPQAVDVSRPADERIVMLCQRFFEFATQLSPQ